MQHLIKLGDFSEVVSRGRYKGQSTKGSYYLSADNYNWMVTKSVGEMDSGQKFWKGMIHAIPRIDEEWPHLDIEHRILDIINALAAKTKKSSTELNKRIAALVLDLQKANKKERFSILSSIGKEIDCYFRICFGNKEHNPSNSLVNPERIYIRLFGMAGLEKE